MDDMEQSLALAKRTLGFLNQQDIVPHPLNYDVIYNYNRGHNKPLIQSVNDLILSKEKHKSDALAEIHAKLISNEVSTQQVDDIATKMTEQITQITEVISTASGETTSYSDVLNKVSGVLNLDVDSEALKTMVGTLMSATTDMEKNLAQLENKLAMSNHQVSELNEHLHTVKMEARTDQLTGIYNRKYYDEAIALEIEVANTENTELCLLMGDIDKFKLFNDNYGHQTGDRVLRLVAQTMFNSVNEPDVVARYGGEEFVVILSAKNLAQGIELGDKMRKAIEAKELKKRSSGENLGKITISFGAALYRKGESAETFITRADDALYLAKDSGRNQVKTELDLPNKKKT